MGITRRKAKRERVLRYASSDRERAGGAVRASVELVAGHNRVLELMARGRPLPHVLDALARWIESQCPGTLASILLLERDGIHVRHGAAPSLPETFTRAVDGEPIGPRAGSCGTAAFRREPVVVDDIASDSLWDDYREIALAHGFRACWSAPIFDEQHRVLGTFALYRRDRGGPDRRQWEMIELASHTAAIAIAREREGEELRRRDAQFAEAERVASIGSYEWDTAADRVHRSRELCRIFGVRPEEFEPTFEGYLDRVHPDDRSRTRSIIERAYREAVPFAFEERIVRPDGSVRLLHSRGDWILDHRGRPTSLVGTCQDITESRQTQTRNLELEREIGERRRVEELLRAKNDELKAFAYTVSHDLKAPLRAISGYARELSHRHRSGLDERALLCLDQILDSTRNLDRLIESGAAAP